jgi:hypothetical protein
MVDIPTVPLTDGDDEDGFSVMRLDTLAAHHALLLDKLQGVEKGTIPNLMLLLPPGSAKSTYADVVFVPWFMARKPRRNVILASYASDIAKKQGRRARQLIKSKSFHALMEVGLKGDQSAADEWALDNGSEYMSGGLLSGLTGNRAALGILDDPIRGREAAESQTIRDKTWDAYTDDFCSRLIPGAPQIMILCMTGDTPVLLDGGKSIPLRDVRPGDVVVSYYDGQIVAAPVLVWKPQGPDSVFLIRMKSGRNVKANKKHPFLVERDGVRQWIRLESLRLNEKVLALKGIGGSGAASSVQRTDAPRPQSVEACAIATMESGYGQQDTARHRLTPKTGGQSNSRTDMALPSKTTSGCWTNKAATAPFANSHLETTSALIGAENSALTIVTTQAGSEGSCVTIAISPLATGKQSKFSLPPLNTYEIEADEILSIEAAGVEEVYDIQVGGAENFIANGLISHNTRWHQDDPAGRILPEGWAGESGVFEGRDGRTWHVVCLPAIADRADDPLGRAIGETLWPEWFSLEHWRPFQRNVRTWTSLYQQKPTAAEGTFFQRAWFNRYSTSERPANLRYYMTSDHAPGDSASSDWNVFRVWGIDPQQRLWEVDGFRDQGRLDVAVGLQHDAMGEQTVADQGALALIRKWKPLCWFPENDNNWKSAKPFIMAAMRKHKIRCRIEEISTAGGDKATKAQPFQAKASMGEVFIRNGPLGDAIIEEYVAFPGGKHDDEVDCGANIGRALDMAHPAIVAALEISDTDRPSDLLSRFRGSDDDAGGFYG